MLRATIAVVGAGLGGADAITVLLFTLALGLPDRSARRRAMRSWCCSRNPTCKVADLAAGAGGIEDLTDKLRRAAWAALQEIEAAGGAWPRCSKVDPKQSCGHAWRARGRRGAAQGCAHRHQRFPRPREAPVAVLEVAPVAPLPVAAAPRFEPPPRIRLAEPFETLRDASDRTLAQTGARPVFLAKVGTPADFTARATFAKNFFEAGGIEAVENDGFESRDALVAAFRASECRPRVPVLIGRGLCARRSRPRRRCGTQAPCSCSPAGPALEGALTQAGVRGFVFAGCDVLAALRTTHGLIAS